MNSLSALRAQIGATKLRIDERLRVETRDLLRMVRGRALSVSPPADGGQCGRILVADMQVPRTDRNAGDRNIVDFMRTLIEAGWDVSYWPRNFRDDCAYSDPLRHMGIEVVAGAARPTLAAWLKAHRKVLRHALVCRPTVAAAYLPVIRRHAGVPVTYYGHDLHFARMQMEVAVLGDRSASNAAATMEALECWAWRQAEVVVYPTNEEVSEVRARCASVDARAIPIFRFDHFAERRSMPELKQVLFVGSFHHSPNVDGAVWLAREIWPQVRRAAPDARLLIVGANPPPAVTALAGEGVEVPGAVSHEELTSLYASSRVAAVPLRVGAGMKLKVVESLALGVPLVTTSVGAQGLRDLGTVSRPVDTADEFAAEAVRLLHLDEDAWLQQSRRQVDDARERFGAEAMRKTLLATLTAAAHAYGATHGEGPQ